MHYYDVIKPDLCTGEAMDILLSLGWYPMGQTVFTTSHLFKDDGSVPQRVHWLRYPVNNIEERSSHRRIRRKCRDFQVEWLEPFTHSDELNELYQRYYDSIDFDGYPTVEKATFYRGDDNIYDARAVLVRDGSALIGCGIFYQGNQSLASILHFFDPAYKYFSPGKFLILKTLDYCRDRGIEWYYPGYIIEGNRKMDYKLFLGRDKAQYYHPWPSPLKGHWKAFTSEILGADS